jgi:integrase
MTVKLAIPRQHERAGRTERMWMVYLDYEDAAGRRRRIERVAPAQSERGARRFERKLLRELAARPSRPRKEVRRDEKPKTPKTVSNRCPTFAEFAEEFMRSYARVLTKPSTQTSYEQLLRAYLRDALGPVPLDEIKVREVDALRAELIGRGLSAKTTNNAIGLLGKILRYAQDVEVLSSVPKIRKLKAAPAAFDFLAFEEADRLLAAAAAHDPEWHAMILVALRTGMRYGELAELRWHDLDLDKGRVMVRRSVWRGHVTTPKGGREAVLPLSPETVRVLKRHKHLRGELVFCKPDGGQRIHRRADAMLKRVCKLAQLRPISWHVLRHTYASHLVMRGASIKATQELMRHRSLEMTLRYAHLSPEVRCDAVAALDEPTPKTASGSGESTPSTARDFGESRRVLANLGESGFPREFENG